METKRIVECLRRCEKITGRADCVGCDYLYLGGLDCYHVLKKDARKRLEELDAELEKRTINDRPYEWISVEDRLPEPRESVLIYDHKNKRIAICRFGNCSTDVGSFYSHWMPLPEPPKPKEPTFKDVFLKAFPKASSVCFKDYCPKSIFESIKCPLPSFCSENDKERCWNQPYFEPKEEGGEE